MSDSSTISYVDVCSIRWLSGESIPIRLFLAGYDLTPTFKDVNKKFSVRYYLNLVLIDEEERRYFKQQVRTMYVAWHFNAVPTIQFPLSTFVPSHPFLVVTIAAKRQEKRLMFKIGTIHPHGLNERFSFILSLHSFCFWSSMCGQKRWLLTFSLHCLCSSTSRPLIRSLASRLHLVYWTTLKIANDLPIFACYYALLCIYYCFSQLIDLFSVT